MPPKRARSNSSTLQPAKRTKTTRGKTEQAQKAVPASRRRAVTRSRTRSTASDTTDKSTQSTIATVPEELIDDTDSIANPDSAVMKTTTAVETFEIDLGGVPIAAKPKVYLEKDEDEIDYSDDDIDVIVKDSRTIVDQSVGETAVSKDDPKSEQEQADTVQPVYEELSTENEAIDVASKHTETQIEHKEQENFAAAEAYAKECIAESLLTQFDAVSYLPQCLGLYAVNDRSTLDFECQGVRYKVTIAITDDDKVGANEEPSKSATGLVEETTEISKADTTDRFHATKTDAIVDHTLFAVPEPKPEEEQRKLSIDTAKAQKSLAEAASLGSGQTSGRKACRFGDNCNKRETCPFDHSKAPAAKLCLWVNTRAGCNKGGDCPMSHEKEGTFCIRSQKRSDCPNNATRMCAFKHKDDVVMEHLSTPLAMTPMMSPVVQALQNQAIAEMIPAMSTPTGPRAQYEAQQQMLADYSQQYHQGFQQHFPHAYPKQQRYEVPRVHGGARGRGRGNNRGGGGGNGYRQAPYNKDQRGEARGNSGNQVRQKNERSGIKIKGVAEQQKP
ncbi:hypothetical protein ACN47E_006756 [Coniothyrium glycines]